MELTADTRATEILADVAENLAAAKLAGKPLFVKALTCDDQDSFVRQADALRGYVAGVIGKLPERQKGTDNSMLYQERMALEICVKLTSIRRPGDGDTDAMSEMNKIATMVRQILLVDSMRGGRAKTIVWGGELINGTNCYGAARLIRPRANQAFYVASIAAVVGWYIAA